MKFIPEVSIIIRTKNEEKWISLCLQSISSQTYNNYEIIIVDNYSTDKTLQKIKKFKISKVLKIKNYLPGKSLNQGIKYSKGKYIVALSAHCIPTNNKWLINLVKAIKSSKKYAGVYGRQEPMSFSPLSDKRDLLLVFGLDKKVQIKDSFFHNANSIIRKSIWKKFPFDNKVTNIEDRLWAKEIIKQSYRILYEPKASVLHYHGIHQNNNKERLENVVNIISDNKILNNSTNLDIKKLKIICIIPIKGESVIINERPLLLKTIETAKKSKYIDRIIVSTDSKKTAKYSKSVGVEAPFVRPISFSKDFVNLDLVQKYSLDKIESSGYIPDLVVHLEETYPFRPDNIIDEMIEVLLSKGFDTIMASKIESGWIWRENNNNQIERVDSGDIPRNLKDKSMIGLHGICVVTYPSFIRNGSLLGNKIGLFNIDHPLANFEVKTKESLQIVKKIFNT